MNPTSEYAAPDLYGIELPKVYPRDLVAIIPMHVPLGFVLVGNLTTGKLEHWLAQRQIACPKIGPRRKLHGALVARSGRGLVFIDTSDDSANQRFTAAHETVHFIEDHLRPRLTALKLLGDAILPVLDGVRPPTREESVSAALNRIPLGPQIHLMARNQRGFASTWNIEEREQRADLLALELMAPASDAHRALRQQLSIANNTVEIGDASRLLACTFGLPMGIAYLYANRLLRRFQSRPRLTDVLLGGDQ